MLGAGQKVYGGFVRVFFAEKSYLLLLEIRFLREVRCDYTVHLFSKTKKNEPKEAKRVAKYVILWNYVSGIS